MTVEATPGSEEPVSSEPRVEVAACVEAACDATPECRQRALVVLEVLAGLRGVPEAAHELGLQVQGYYQLEERAVKGLVAACAVQPGGPRRNLEKELDDLRRDHARLTKECARYQALVRTAQLTVGLDADQKPPIARQRKRRPVVRALRAIRRLESPHGGGK